MKVRGRQNYPDSKSIAGTVLPVKYLKGTFSLKRFLSRDNGQETFVTDPSVFQKSFSSSFSKRNFNFCSRQMSVRGKKEHQFWGVSKISFSRESWERRFGTEEVSLQAGIRVGDRRSTHLRPSPRPRRRRMGRPPDMEIGLCKKRRVEGSPFYYEHLETGAF